MFNQAGPSLRYSNYKVLGGVMPGDYGSHKTLFAGPDPANPSRVLIRKLVQTSEHVWCFEEARISPSADGAQPSVHTTLHRLGWLDINEKMDQTEVQTRLQFRPMPNVIGFSLFTRPWTGKKSVSWTLVENSLLKQSNYRWAEWFRDLQDRRDIASYLNNRWLLN